MSIDNTTDFIIECIYDLERQGNYFSLAEFIITWIEQLANTKSYHEINEIFQNIDINKLSEYGMIALLRGSFFCKHKLSEYSEFLIKCKDSLKDAVDTKKTFYGLDK